MTAGYRIREFPLQLAARPGGEEEEEQRGRGGGGGEENNGRRLIARLPLLTTPQLAAACHSARESEGRPNVPLEINEAIEEAISYASFYFINQRYGDSPDFNTTYLLMYNYMTERGYSVNNSNIDYVNGGAAELGNYIASQVLNYGNNDGSNEFLDFENIFYSSIF